MELSVIIVSFNVREYLAEALTSVIAASGSVDSEIIVVDNCSSDGSDEMVALQFKDVILIRNDKNIGFGAACNIGIQSSSGRYILILNPDTFVQPDAITAALGFMEQHPEAGAAGARMVDGNGTFLPESKRGFPSPHASLFRFTGLGKIFPHSSFFNAYYLGHLPDNMTCRADILTGAFMLIRREALEKAGLFDTSFFMYGEDIDLSWRLVRAGYTNYYVAEARITHFKGKSTAEDDILRIRRFYEAMIIFAGKHLRKSWQLPVKAGVKVMLALRLIASSFRQMVKKISPVVKKG
ncbi:MAG TPA: glycosyltransferase family 2 protein [Bacteroidales bacterium]|nr:glycosyltransferase family 2 protein [Bacteroidales bacterium]